MVEAPSRVQVATMARQVHNQRDGRAFAHAPWISCLTAMPYDRWFVRNMLAGSTAWLILGVCWLVWKLIGFLLR
jgi:hypothetical protein